MVRTQMEIADLRRNDFTDAWAKVRARERGLSAYVDYLREVKSEALRGVTEEQFVTGGQALFREGMLKLVREQAARDGAPSFSALMEPLSAFMQELARVGVPEPVAMAMAMVTMKQLWHEAAYEVCGRKLYEVSPGLASQLAHTELRGLGTDDVKLPFSAIYITVPPEAGLTVYNEHSGWHRIAGVHLAEDLAVPYADQPDTAVRTWRLLVWGASKNPDDPYDDALFHFLVPLPAGQTLDEALVDEQQRAETSAVRGAALTDPALARFYREHWRPMFSWAMNVAMYATWPDCEATPFIADRAARQLWERHQRAAKGSPKRRELLDAFRTLPPTQREVRIVLGRGVEPLPPGDAAGAARALTVRTLVSGHWQRFAIGKGRTERRWGWRSPFWRGPKDGPETSHAHVLV